MRSTWWQLAGVGLALVASGCSQFSSRTGLPKLGLPSPQATIAASDKQKAADRPRLRRSSLGNSQQGDSGTNAKVTEAVSRGRSLEQAGQLDRARKTYEVALADNPDSAPLLHRLGIVADRQKQHGEAEKFFLAALDSAPRNANVLGDLGYCYFLQGQLDQAHEALADAVAIDPKNPRHRNNLGLVLGHQQDYDAAFAQFAATGSEADALYNMAFVFAAQDMTAEAKGCFQEALAADPSHGPAKEALASFEAYDRKPANGRDADVELAGDVRLVPYVEPELADGEEPVQQASATTSLPASRDVGRTTRTLQLRSRGLLGRHMQQQRGAGLQPAMNGQVENLPHD